jgi:psp operon transcriptional activator
MENHLWPGNVRELRNVVERAVYRWADPAQPVDYIQFDPFDSPWRGGVAASAPAQVQADNQNNVAEPRYATDPGQAVDVNDFREATEKFEKSVLEQALAKCRYNQRQTAKALNLSYDQLRHTLKKHDLLG